MFDALDFQELNSATELSTLCAEACAVRVCVDAGGGLDLLGGVRIRIARGVSLENTVIPSPVWPLFAWCDRCPCSVCLTRWRARTGMGGGGAVASQQQRCHENEKRRRHGLSERLAVASQLPARWIFHTCALVTQGRGESLLSPVRQSHGACLSATKSVSWSLLEGLLLQAPQGSLRGGFRGEASFPAVAFHRSTTRLRGHRTVRSRW